MLVGPAAIVNPISEGMHWRADKTVIDVGLLIAAVLCAWRRHYVDLPAQRPPPGLGRKVDFWNPYVGDSAHTRVDVERSASEVSCISRATAAISLAAYSRPSHKH
jgi:hypothetical protein